MMKSMKIKRNERKWIVVTIYERVVMIYAELWWFMKSSDDLWRVVMIDEELRCKL